MAPKKPSGAAIHRRGPNGFQVAAPHWGAGQSAISHPRYRMSERDRSSASQRRIAYEAARIMAEEAVTDFDRARRKAAERTGILDRRRWPTNEAIAEALLTHRRLFLGDAEAARLRRLRAAAVQAMRSFRAFGPRLIGPLLNGAGPLDAGVQLYLFADRPEDVLFALLERRIPWHERERSIRYANGERRNHPVFRFVAGEAQVELIVLPSAAHRNPPLDPITERPARGADIAEVERLLAADADGAHAPLPPLSAQ
jgi:hypothetical protein